jgi:Holliday junction resolvasome RuvABC endonuclease subunit
MIKKIIDVSGFDLKKNNRKKDDAFDALGIAICAALKSY